MCVKFFSNNIDVDDIADTHKYLMKKQNMK